MVMKMKFLALKVLTVVVVLIGVMALPAFAAEPHGLTCKRADGSQAEEGEDYIWVEIPSLPWNLKILKSGLVISGTSDNEVVLIETDEDVELVLDNVTIAESGYVGIRNPEIGTLTILLKGTNKLGDGPEEYTGDESECDRLSSGIVTDGDLIIKDYSSSTAGNLTVYCTDEGVYSVGNLTFADVKGKYIINSGDAAIAADGELSISGGKFDLYGSIEAAHITTKYCTFTGGSSGGTSRSSRSSSSGAFFTGAEGNPVSNGTWVYSEATDTWSYTTSRVFKNTWAYISNPFAGPDQHQADWFYFDANGVMVTGWQQLYWNGVQGNYYFNEISDGTRGALQQSVPISF